MNFCLASSYKFDVRAICVYSPRTSIVLTDCTDISCNHVCGSVPVSMYSAQPLTDLRIQQKLQLFLFSSASFLYSSRLVRTFLKQIDKAPGLGKYFGEVEIFSPCAGITQLLILSEHTGY